MNRPGTVRLLAALAVVLLVAVVASGPGQAASSPKVTLTVVIGSEPVSLQPADVSDAASEQVLLNLYEPLVTLSPTGTIEPLLVESWKVVDAVTYEFRLRPGVKFHDGKLLTTDEVVGALNEFVKPASGKPYLSPFNVNIKEAAKVDDQTFTIKTTVPFGPFLRNLTQIRIVPTHISRDDLAKRVVGTGPYRLTEYAPGSSYTMDRFDGYWGPKPAVDRIIFRIVPEASARVAEAQAGRADLVANVAPELVPVVQRIRTVKLVVAPATYRISLTYNTKSDTPIKNPKVRQAINYAINYEAIIKGILGGYGQRVGPLIRQDLGYNAHFKDYTFDPAKAHALLGEAGYANGFSVTIATPQGRYIKDKEISEAVSGMLHDVGITAQVQVNEWGTHIKQIVGHTIAPIYLIGWRGVNFDPSAALLAWDCTSPFSNYCDSRVQQDLTIGLSSVTSYKRVQAYQDALSIYLTDPPAAYLYQETALYIVRDTLRWTPRVDQLILVKTISTK